MNVVCTAHDAAYQAMAEITLPSVKRYAAKHGYGLVYDGNIDPTIKDACKAQMFLELYKSGRFSGDDLFLWIDTDALVMNSDVKILAPGSAHFLWSYDWNGPNSGVYIARFTSHAAHFIRTYDYLARAMGWGDNWGMNQTMLLPPFRDWVRMLPGRWMNSNLYELHGIADMAHKYEINAYQHGDWILHLAGVPEPLRTDTLREYADLAV